MDMRILIDELMSRLRRLHKNFAKSFIGISKRNFILNINGKMKPRNKFKIIKSILNVKINESKHKNYSL